MANLVSKKNVNNFVKVSVVVASIIVVIAIVYKGFKMVRLVHANNSVTSEGFAPVSGDANIEFKSERVDYEKPDGPSTMLLPDGAPYSDLLPDGTEEDGSNLLSKISFLDAGHHAGVDSIGSTLKNASLDLRREPPNPKRVVGPWRMSPIEPDPFKKSLDM